MATVLNCYYVDGGVWYRLDAGSGSGKSWRNTNGTPIVSVTPNQERLLVAGIYKITVSSVTGTSAVINVEAQGDDAPKNPVTQSGITVTNDGTTANKNVIPGLSIVFDIAATSDVGYIYVGSYYDGAAENDVVNFGTVDAGNYGPDSTGRKIYVKNDGTYDVTEAQVRIINAVRIEQDYPQRPFYKTYQNFDYNPIKHSSTSGVPVTFANVGGGTCDVLLDGSTFHVQEVGGTYSGLSTGLNMDDSTIYEVTDNTSTFPIGWRFVLSSSLQGTDTAVLHVHDGGEHVEIAPDVSGAPGTWQDGTTALTIGDSGGIDGDIAVGDSGIFWIRFHPASSTTPDLNMRLFTIVTKARGY